DRTLQYGNIDWRGTGGLSVSWHAGTTRALNHLGPENLDTRIYRGGMLLAVAPGPVSGAALQGSPDGTTSLIAVVTSSSEPDLSDPNLPKWPGTDVVYRKTLPNGDWYSVGEFSYPLELIREPDRHVGLWHFSPDGTEAMSVKTAYDPSRIGSIYYTQVYKLTVPVDGTIAQVREDQSLSE